MKLEREREERLRQEQQLREEKHKQEQRTTSNFWDFLGSSPSSSSSDKTYVKGYKRKDGTNVKGHYRQK